MACTLGSRLRVSRANRACLPEGIPPPYGWRVHAPLREPRCLRCSGILGLRRAQPSFELSFDVVQLHRTELRDQLLEDRSGLNEPVRPLPAFPVSLPCLGASSRCCACKSFFSSGVMVVISRFIVVPFSHRQSPRKSQSTLGVDAASGLDWCLFSVVGVV